MINPQINTLHFVHSILSPKIFTVIHPARRRRKLMDRVVFSRSASDDLCVMTSSAAFEQAVLVNP